MPAVTLGDKIVLLREEFVGLRVMTGRFTHRGRGYTASNSYISRQLSPKFAKNGPRLESRSGGVLGGSAAVEQPEGEGIIAGRLRADQSEI